MNAISVPVQPDVTDIQDWLIAYLSRELSVDSSELDVGVPFSRYGLSSMTAVLMTGEMMEWLDRNLDPTLPYDYPTIRLLSEYLASSAPGKGNL